MSEKIREVVFEESLMRSFILPRASNTRIFPCSGPLTVAANILHYFADVLKFLVARFYFDDINSLELSRGSATLFLGQRSELSDLCI